MNTICTGIIMRYYYRAVWW